MLYNSPRDPLEDEDLRWQASKNEVQAFMTPRLPRASIIVCGSGGALLAVGGLLHVVCVIDPE